MPHFKHVTVNGPLDAITVIPHVLGFHPDDSIVVLTLGESQRTTAFRGDHPHDAGDMLALLAGAMLALPHFASRANLIVCYTSDKEHAYACATLLREELPGDILEPLMVHQGHYWQIDHDDFEGPGQRFIASDLGLDPLDVALDRETLMRRLKGA